MGFKDYDAKQLAVLTGILVLTLMLGAGFLFGPAASYAGVTGGGQNPSGQEFNASLPGSTFSDGSYGRSLQEMRVLAVQNDVVFVTVIYSSAEQKDALEQDLSQLPGAFNGRLYIELVNESSSGLARQYGITEFPRAIVIGGSTTNSGIGLVETVNRQQVSDATCQALRSWSGSISAYCAG